VCNADAFEEEVSLVSRSAERTVWSAPQSMCPFLSLSQGSFLYGIFSLSLSFLRAPFCTVFPLPLLFPFRFLGFSLFLSFPFSGSLSVPSFLCLLSSPFASSGSFLYGTLFPFLFLSSGSFLYGIVVSFSYLMFVSFLRVPLGMDFPFSSPFLGFLSLWNPFLLRRAH